MAARPSSFLTGVEIACGPDDLIVSKTDLGGRITYVNEVFTRVSGYTPSEAVGAPHRIVRHPAMPRCVFKLLWDVIEAEREIFAYVLNRAKNGDEYWVLAHVTPSYSLTGEHVGYHSNRRCPPTDALPAVRALYARLLAAEKNAASAAEGLARATQLLNATLEDAGCDYDAFVFNLSRETRLPSLSP